MISLGAHHLSEFELGLVFGAAAVMVGLLAIGFAIVFLLLGSAVSKPES